MALKKGWYCGLASRFSNHYYVKIKQDGIQSRCGQISLKMLRGEGISSLKLMKTEIKNRCRGCENLLRQDEEHTRLIEPYRY